MTKRKQLGDTGEDIAVDIYKKKGFVVIARNVFNHRGKQLGELDFVAVKDKAIHFVEVKTRSSYKFGLPELSVTKFKQVKIIKSVMWFLNKYPKYQNFKPQIDVCALIIDPDMPTKEFQKTSTALDKSVKYAKIYLNAVEMK